MPFRPTASGPNPYIIRNSGVGKTARGPFRPTASGSKLLGQIFVFFCVLCVYALMYVNRLLFAYVCGRFSYLCTFVEPAVFGYIRELFSFGPTFGEDFGFDVAFFCM